jgi:thioredoxin 1
MKIFKKLVLVLTGALFSLLSGALFAVQNFDKTVFEKLIADGKPVVVDFYAPWCPTCRTQETILKELASDPSLKNITVIRADYDYDKRLLRVNRQSTFVVFKDGKEVARSTGQTNRQRIIDLFKQAL